MSSKMSKLQLFQAFLTDRLTVAAIEILGAMENTITEYQEEMDRAKEENARLQRLLDLVFKPEIKLHRTGLCKGRFIIKINETQALNLCS